MARRRQASILREIRIHAAAACSALLLAAAAPPAIAAETDAAQPDDARPATTVQPRLIVVFDGSGSMWGKMPGSDATKLQVAREALRNALTASGRDIAIGLTTFGARSGSSCSSAETRLSPAPGQAGTFLDELSSFNPQGRGPIGLALQTAVDALKTDPSNADRLLVIHDGPDNCGNDVCAVARELATTRPGLAVDVVSLDLKSSQRGTLECLTNATGGTLAEASDAATAKRAIERAVATLATNARPLEGAQTSRRHPPAPKKPATPEKPNTGLTLAAYLEGDETPLLNAISWQIVAQDPDATLRATTMSPAAAAKPLKLEPGRYRVSLNSPLVNQSREVTITSDEHKRLRFDIEAGLIHISDVTSRTTSPAPDAGRFIHVATDAGETIWSGPDTAARYLLMRPGRYEITASNGLASQALAIDLKTGQREEIAFGARPARLLVTVAGLQEGQRRGAMLAISRDDPEGSTPTVVARSAATRSAAFSLPAGTYTIGLTAGPGATAREIVVLAANQTYRRTIKLNQMALRVTTYIDDSEKPASGRVRHRLWRAGQLDRPLAIRHDADTVFHLTPGKFRLESRIGYQNAIMIRDFDIGPSPRGLLELRHDAGRVTLARPEDAAAATAALRQNTYWEIFDNNGRLMWRTFEPQPELTLSAGKYQTSLHMKGRRWSSKFIVVAGHDQVVTPIED